MSLYREAGGRGAAPLVGVLLAGALIGGLLGFLLGSSGDEEASLADALEEVQAEVRPALSELELVTIEYAESVKGGQVVAETEYRASVDHVERALSALEGAASDLEVLAPEELAMAERSLNQLAELVEAHAPAAQVNAAAAEADAAVRAAARIEGSPPQA